MKKTLHNLCIFKNNFLQLNVAVDIFFTQTVQVWQFPEVVAFSLYKKKNRNSCFIAAKKCICFYQIFKKLIKHFKVTNVSFQLSANVTVLLLLLDL